MRSLWLASAASLFFAGAACAQTSTPAPTGAPSAATVTGPGQSPGSTGSNPSSSSTAAPDGSGAAPAGNASGAPNAAVVTPPGKSAGKTSSSGSAQGSGMMPASTKPMMSTSTMTYTHHHHHYMGGMGYGGAMPANASAGTYLHIAKMSIMHHNKGSAEEALSRAETVMLNRAVPQGDVGPDSSPGVGAIESARHAVSAGDMKTALSDTNMAMQQSGGSSDMSAMPATAMPASASSAPAVGSFKSENMPISSSVPQRTGAASQHPELLGTTPANGGAPEVTTTH